MAKQELLSIHIKTLSEHHQLSDVAKPKHPLFSLLRFEDFPEIKSEKRVKIISDLYQLALKKDCPCKLQYGQTTYDFNEGVMSFFAPGQVHILEPDNILPRSGYLVLIHPDFIRGTFLNQKIKSYGFFNYNVNEALILSEEEERSVELIFNQIEEEYQRPIDDFSQDVIITNIGLLLTYSNRYYNRQFITRKLCNSELLQKMDQILEDYFEKDLVETGLPTVNFLASELNLSPKYLSDCLKQLVGYTAQQFIQNKLIELSKDILSSTELSVSEIAYKLGFEYPQSFNKLFKNRTGQTPLEYRHLFN